MSVMEEFKIWHDASKADIKHVIRLLEDNLSDEPEALIADLESIEGWNSRCGLLLAMAESWLDRAKWDLMPSREEDLTVFEKESKLDSLVAPIRLVRDTLQSLLDSIKQRLILGESVLSFQKQFSEFKSRDLNLKVG